MTSPGPSGSAPPLRSGPSWTDLGPRIISAAILVAVIATGLYFGGYVFAGLAAIVFGLTYREWEQMVTLAPLAPFGMVLIGLLAIAAVSYPMFVFWPSIFLAWACKSLVVRFAGVDSARRLNAFFLGLIVGDVTSMLFWIVIDGWQGHLGHNLMP